MYAVEEPRYWLEPPTYEAIGYCRECGCDIYEGNEIWEINGDWYCEECIRDAQREVYKEDLCNA